MKKETVFHNNMKKIPPRMLMTIRPVVFMSDRTNPSIRSLAWMCITKVLIAVVNNIVARPPDDVLACGAMFEGDKCCYPIP